MSIAIAIVAFNPTLNTRQRLADVSNLGLDVYVYDNTDSQSEIDMDISRVKYFGNGKNIGLSKGMNFLFKKAFESGHDWVIFFDQDTVYNKETIDYITDFLEFNRETIGNFFCLQFADDLGFKTASNNIESRQIVINSGTAFNLEKLNNIGWMNETYFVDLIDYEVCFRAKLKRWKIGKVLNTPGLDHKAEQDDSVYAVFGREVVGRAYSGSRVLDYCKNSMRLIGLSIGNLDFSFSALILKNLIIYMLTQSVFRVLKPLKKIDGA